MATAAATVVAAHWAFPTQAGLDIGMYLPNSTWHNMPFAARFVQDHQVGALLYTEPLKLSVWFYPQNSELLHSSGILFFGNDGSSSESGHHVVAKLREYFLIEELGIRELGFGTNADHSSWALLAESRRGPDYCRRLVGKAYREAMQESTAPRTGTSR